MFFIQFRWQSDLQIEFDLAFFFLWIGMFSEFGTHRYVLNSHRQKLQMIDIWILFWCGKKNMEGNKTHTLESATAPQLKFDISIHKFLQLQCCLLHRTQTHSGGYGNKKKKKEKENIYFSGEGKKTKEMSKLKFAHTKYPQQYHKHHPTTDKNNN